MQNHDCAGVTTTLAFEPLNQYETYGLFKSHARHSCSG
jgi:hypothetical protein